MCIFCVNAAMGLNLTEFESMFTELASCDRLMGLRSNSGMGYTLPPTLALSRVSDLCLLKSGYLIRAKDGG